MSKERAPDQLTVRCPDCSSTLTVDAGTGKVLHHAARASSSRDFDELLARVDDDKRRAEKLFEQEQAALADRERLLEQQFEDALGRVDEADDGTPPARPFDLD